MHTRDIDMRLYVLIRKPSSIMVQLHAPT